jgi:hypothetical protein
MFIMTQYPLDVQPVRNSMTGEELYRLRLKIRQVAADYRGVLDCALGHRQDPLAHFLAGRW